MAKTLIIDEKFQQFQSEIVRLIDRFDVEGEMVVKGSRNVIKKFPFNEGIVSIKYFKRPHLVNRIIYRYFRASKAKRSYDYAQRLLKGGIDTPYPIAYMEDHNGIGLADSCYICQHIEYDFTFRELIHDPLFENRALILEQFTEFTYKLHENNVNFLDHSPGNTLIKKVGPSEYKFYLIDLNRMTFKSLSLEARMDNFKKLWLSKTMVRIISKKYAELMQEDEVKLHGVLLEKSLGFKRKITKKKYLKRKLKKKKM